MAVTPSTMKMRPGDRAPDFSLPGIDGRTWSLSDFDDQELLLVIFMCNHCPYVVHVHEELAALGRDYGDRSVAVVAINSNDPMAHSSDDFANMKAYAERWGLTFPYLQDETQEVAKAYKASCTPDFFLFDSDRRLLYRGRLDGSQPRNGVPVTGEDLRSAIDQALAGGEVTVEQRPSVGCNIKWKLGNAPEYFQRARL